MTLQIEITSKAKVNLYLHIVGKCGNYHHLDSIVSFAEFGDKIVLEEADKDSLIIHSYDAIPKGRDNILIKSLEFLRKNLPNIPSGLKINLHKNIPMQSGFGGGSGNGGGTYCHRSH